MTIQEVNETVSDVTFYSYENITLVPVSTSSIKDAFDHLGLMNLSVIIQYQVSKKLDCYSDSELSLCISNFSSLDAA